MKHIQIITPFKMQWLSGYRKIFSDFRVTISDSPHPEVNPDVMMFMWADLQTKDFINNYHKKSKYVVFVRRYELFFFDMISIDWDKVDEIIMVNDVLAQEFEEITNRTPHVIYNGVIPEEWTYRERGHGKKIAWVGFINSKKNLQLALQILNELPKNYEFHIAGTVQDAFIMLYLRKMAELMELKNIIFYGQVKNMNEWLDDKNYILSTAISEGCPNNVIEAMAKGIKPIIHMWPGADIQFHKHTFITATEAKGMISPGSEYDSVKYRHLIEIYFGLDTFKKVRELVEGLWGK